MKQKVVQWQKLPVTYLTEDSLKLLNISILFTFDTLIEVYNKGGDTSKVITVGLPNNKQDLVKNFILDVNKSSKDVYGKIWKEDKFKTENVEFQCAITENGSFYIKTSFYDGDKKVGRDYLLTNIDHLAKHNFDKVLTINKMKSNSNENKTVFVLDYKDLIIACHKALKIRFTNQS